MRIPPRTAAASNLPAITPVATERRTSKLQPPVALDRPSDKTPATEAQRRELSAHLAELGLPANTPNPVKAIANKELEKAQALDPRVTESQMATAVRRATQALTLEPVPQTNLFGFTRLIDAKLNLNPETIAALAERALDRPRGASPKPDQKVLLNAIAKGPGDGSIAWKRPTSKTELVASVVRHLVLGGGASLQLALTPELLSWLEGALPKQSGGIKEAMGGAGGFCANLASALPHVDAHFFSADPLPPRVAERFSSQVRSIDGEGSPVPLARVTDARSNARVNVAAEYGKSSFQVLGKSSLLMDGQVRALEATARGRIILGTPGRDRATFGDLSDKALDKMARSHELFFLAGPHHLTSAEPGTCPGADDLARQLDRLKRANPTVVRHWQYVVPKVAENEPLLLQALRGKIDSMSLNSVELPGLVSRLATANLAKPPSDANPPRDVAEQPGQILEAAMRVKNGMGVGRIHIHGFQGDLLIMQGPVDPERQALALLRARQMASVKAAQATGEIKSAADVFPVAPIVQGIGLAGLEAFADALTAKLGLTDAQREKVRERWWHRDEKTDTTYVFAPTRGIHEATGGTISLGDTIDGTALIFGKEASNRGKKLLHPSSFG